MAVFDSFMLGIVSDLNLENVILIQPVHLELQRLMCAKLKITRFDIDPALASDIDSSIDS